MAVRKKRRYASQARADSAEETRKRILDAARALFGRRGIDRVTVADIGAKADVAGSTVYSIFKSKTGIIRALMERALFGDRFRSAQELLAGVADPVKLVELTPRVARAIYESESTALGLMRGASAFSPALRKAEQAFEDLRYSMQEARVRLLFDEGKARPGLGLDEARRILWMYTGRDIYRMLVQEGGWSPDEYEAWLARTLVTSLVRPESR